MAYYVVMSVVLIILILLIMPVRLNAAFRDDFSAKIGFFFLSFNIYPGKPGKKNKTKKVSEKEQKSSGFSIKALYKERGLSGFTELIKEIYSLLTTTLKSIVPHLKVKNIRILITVATDNAADTAIRYGYVSSIVFPISGWVISNIDVKQHYIKVTPDFEKKASELDCNLKLSVRVIFILITAVKVIKGIYKIQKQNLITEKTKEEK